MRLIDVEVARQPRNHNRPSGKTTETASARAAPLQTAAFALRAFAKFLDALLNFVLAAAAKILRAPLRSADAHGFRRAFRSRAVERQRGNITAISILPATEQAGCPAARQSGKRAVQREALKSAARSNERRQISQPLVLLPRSQNHFRVKFSAGSFRLQHHFLRL